MTKATYTIEEFNNGTLYAVIMNMADGSTELCSSYYKSKAVATRMLKKCNYWAGITEEI